MDSKTKLPLLLLFGHLVCPLCSHFSQFSRIAFIFSSMLVELYCLMVCAQFSAYCLLSHSSTEVPAFLLRKEAAENQKWGRESCECLKI